MLIFLALQNMSFLHVKLLRTRIPMHNLPSPLELHFTLSLKKNIELRCAVFPAKKIARARFRNCCVDQFKRTSAIEGTRKGSTLQMQSHGWTSECVWLLPSLPFADDHTTSNTPDLFRTPKLSGVGPGQY